MSPPRTPATLNIRHALLALGCVAAFLLAATATALPELHRALHADAAQAQHECAISHLASGQYHVSDAAPVVRPPAVATQFATVPLLRSVWVPSPFLRACIFEHAPPAAS